MYNYSFIYVPPPHLPGATTRSEPTASGLSEAIDASKKRTRSRTERRTRCRVFELLAKSGVGPSVSNTPAPAPNSRITASSRVLPFCNLGHSSAPPRHPRLLIYSSLVHGFPGTDFYSKDVTCFQSGHESGKTGSRLWSRELRRGHSEVETGRDSWSLGLPASVFELRISESRPRITIVPVSVNKNTPPDRRTGQKFSFGSTESGAGLQFLLLGRMAPRLR